MFGTNRSEKQVSPNQHGPLWVQEVFETIQGEGPDTGTPAVFVRLAGCNLRCHFCDTDFESSTWRPTMPELIGRITGLAADARRGGRWRLGLVVLTGGEPLRQPIVPLVEQLNELGFRVQIETAGTLSYPGIAPLFLPPDPVQAASARNGNSIVCSPKTPKVHPDIAFSASAFKYILSYGDISPDDGLPMRSAQDPGREAPPYRPPSHFPRHRIFVQPCEAYKRVDATKVLIRGQPDRAGDPQSPCGALAWVRDDDATALNVKASVEVCMRYGYRLSLQTHKLVGLP